MLVLYKVSLLSQQQSPGRYVILPKSQTQSSEWLKLGVRPDVLFETWLQRNLTGPVCVEESQPDSGEGEVRKGLTKDYWVCRLCVSLGSAPWLPPCCPPLIHLPQLIWFPLMFQHCFNTGGPSYSVCTGIERETWSRHGSCKMSDMWVICTLVWCILFSLSLSLVIQSI